MSPSAPAAAAPRRRALPALTGLRFLAALLVLVFHTLPSQLRGGDGWLTAIVDRGYVGVGCFFVLSGFVLGYNYLGDRGMTVPKAEFWRARFARVYPLYAFALVVALPHFLYAAGKAPAEWPPHRVALTLLTAPTLAQAWFPNAAACAWNCPGWSLSAEAFFYLTFPLAGALLARRAARGLLVAAVVFAVAAAIPPTVFSLAADFGDSLGTARWLTIIDYLPPLRLPEFALGIALGVLFTRREDHDGRFGWWGSLALASGLAVFAVLALAPETEAVSGYLHAGGLAALYGVLVYSLANVRGPALGLATPVGVLLGEASYALYILHVPLARWQFALGTRVPFALETVARRAGVSETDALAAAASHFIVDSTGGWIIYVAATLAVSVLALRYIEDPARRYLRRRGDRRRDDRRSSADLVEVVAEP